MEINKEIEYTEKQINNNKKAADFFNKVSSSPSNFPQKNAIEMADECNNDNTMLESIKTKLQALKIIVKMNVDTWYVAHRDLQNYNAIVMPTTELTQEEYELISKVVKGEVN